MEEGPRKYHDFIRRRLGSAQAVVAIDVHTGLGKYARDTILVDTSRYEQLRRVYGERVAPSDPLSGPAYRVRGGLHTLLPHALRDTRINFLTQEFGTYNAIRVLHALREENRWHHHGAGTPDHPTRRHLMKIFCPDDPAWRKAVLGRGRELILGAWSVLGEQVI
jgi:hypothetical protein